MFTRQSAKHNQAQLLSAWTKDLYGRPGVGGCPSAFRLRDSVRAALLPVESNIYTNSRFEAVLPGQLLLGAHCT